MICPAATFGGAGAAKPQLVQRLKELGLGVKIHMVESVEVDADWFESI